MRWIIVPLVVVTLACTATTSVTRTGTGIFAPKENLAEEDDVPRGLSLSVESIASDGTVKLVLRNYSSEPFVFSGTPDHPRLNIEVDQGNTHSRHTISPFHKTETSVAAGDRIELTANIAGASGRVRFGVKSQDVGYTVWTDWIAP